MTKENFAGDKGAAPYRDGKYGIEVAEKFAAVFHDILSVSFCNIKPVAMIPCPAGKRKTKAARKTGVFRAVFCQTEAEISGSDSAAGSVRSGCAGSAAGCARSGFVRSDCAGSGCSRGCSA